MRLEEFLLSFIGMSPFLKVPDCLGRQSGIFFCAFATSLSDSCVNKNSPVVNGAIADSRMPSTNRQLINYSGGSVYLGNPTNVSDVFIQDTSGTTSVNDVNSKLTNGSWTTVTVNSSTNYTVPDNGVLYFSVGSASTSPEYIVYTISDWRTIRINVYSGFTETKYVPVAKGDIIKFSSQSSNVSNVLVQYRKMY